MSKTTLESPIRVNVQHLEVGDVLARPIYTRHGVRLVTSGQPLTEAMLRALTADPEAELYEDQADEEAALPIDSKEPSLAQEPEPGAGDRARALVRALDMARDEQRASPFEFEPIDLEDHHGALRDRANLLKRTEEIITLKQRTWRHLRRRVAPFTPTETLDTGDLPDWSTQHTLHADRCTLIDAFRPHFADLSAGLGAPFDALLALADELIARAHARPMRFASLLYHPSLDPADLPAHALLTGAASAAIASRLSWTLDDTRLAVVTGLVADVGMAMVPADVRRSAHPLDEIGSNRVLRHPAHTVALLSESDLPPIVALGAYQHHERLDASGYPALDKDDAVCDLARVASVADAYVASISTRPYRPAHRPYDALEQIILLGAKDKFDKRVVRALVEVTGLYPVGGFVRLSTGEVARVVGTNPDRIDRPEVRVVATQKTIDLSTPDAPRVVAPTDPPLSLRTRRVA